MAETNYSDLTEEQLLIVNEYCENDMKKLKKVCYIVWGKINLPFVYYDDLYSDAMKVLLESVRTFREGRLAKFNTYLTNNIRLSFSEWFRDNNLRAKRSNLGLDAKGNIKRDEKGNPTTIIRSLSIDDPTEDGVNLYEKISSGFKIENEIEELSYIGLEDDVLEECSSEMREYLNIILSKLQRKVLELIINDYSKEKIMETLHIDSALYSDSIAAITSNKNTRKLRKSLEEKKNVG